MAKITEEKRRYDKIYRKRNFRKIKERMKKYYEKTRKERLRIGKIYVQKNKKRIYKYQNEYAKKNRWKYKERVNAQKRIYTKRPEVRFKENIIRKTKRKYGRLKKGYEYHHNSKPYHKDKFNILETGFHRFYHGNKSLFNMKRRL